MLTQFFRSINWVDVGLAVVFIRVVFLIVKTGFIAETCRSLGTVIAVYVALHNYSGIAAWVTKKVSFSPHIIELFVFIGLWAVVMVIMKFVRDGLLMLFKVETTHKGFDQYAAGILGVGRGLLVCSLIMFAVFLSGHMQASQMALRSLSYNIVGRAAIKTYAFLHHQIVERFVPKAKYNHAVDGVGRLKV
jgi:uncharacterized membrane protein required for colicin V production